MATIEAIAGVTQGILSLLENARSGDFSAVAISAYRTSDFAPITTTTPDAISVHLYRVAVSTGQRNIPARIDASGRRLRPALPVDLHFLITAWSGNILRQQVLLAWAMRILEDNPIIPPALLKVGTRQPFRADESVDLVAVPLSTVEQVAIWEFNKAVMQPSTTYAARMVSIESELEPVSDTLVRTRQIIRQEGT
jgi:hypothetical protein